MSYVKASDRGSWHLFSTYTRSGSILTRCGRTLDPAQPQSDGIPGHDRSCENCLRYHAMDEARQEIPNDTVPE